MVSGDFDALSWWLAIQDGSDGDGDDYFFAGRVAFDFLGDGVGNVEGAGIVEGGCDVLVCDGFVGNVLLKFYESVASFIVGLLTNALGDTQNSQDLEEVFRLLDYTETGGAPLLGVNGIPIICHGGSPPKAIEGAIYVADRAAKASMVSHFVGELNRPTESGSAV
jgi:glycerol-3-phosphate acyltransferase PlsX